LGVPPRRFPLLRQAVRSRFYGFALQAKTTKSSTAILYARLALHSGVNNKDE
jgi:hypothetical protein